MPSQIFRIIRAPEEPPLSPIALQNILWNFKKSSEWEVREMDEEATRARNATLEEAAQVADGLDFGGIIAMKLRDMREPVV